MSLSMCEPLAANSTPNAVARAAAAERDEASSAPRRAVFSAAVMAFLVGSGAERAESGV
jgi:hypothetical protein